MALQINHNKILGVVAALVFIWFVFRLSEVHYDVPTPEDAAGRPPMSSKWDAAPNEGQGLVDEDVPTEKEFPAANKPSMEEEPLTSVGILKGQELKDFCDRHRFRPFDSDRLPYRKIYDLLLVNTELDMLEVRLGEMYPYVDYFIILEADRTFTNHPKKLYIEENWDMFAKYHDKMIRRTVDMSELDDKADAWAREKLSRNAMVNQVLPFLKGDEAVLEDDVLLVSDVDEIPKPSVLQALRNCNVPQRITINAEFYYYSFQWLSREEWSHPQATLWKGNDTAKPEELRFNAKDYHFKHGAWHCSYCFSTMEETVGKVNSFSHQEYNKPEFKDPKKILERVRFGKDFFDRGDHVYDYVETNHDVPAFLKKNTDKFGFMLDRNPPNANFRDIPKDADVTDLTFG